MATVSGQVVRVHHVAELTWTEESHPQQHPQSAGQDVKPLLEQAGMSADAALVCLPREMAVIRHLDVPRVPEDELAEIVPLQTATKSSQPVEQLMIDFLPQPDRPGSELGSVLSASLPRSIGDTIRKTFEAAGLQLTGIGLSSIGLAELSRGFLPVQSGEILVAACLQGGRLEVAFADDGNIRLTQSATISPLNSETVAAELRKMTFLAEQTLGEFAVGQTVVFVGDEDFTELADLQNLSSDDLALQRLADSPQVKIDARLPESFDPVRLVGPVGFCLNRQLQTFPGIDFLHPRRKTETKDDSRRKMAIYAAGALTVLGLGYYSFSSYLGELEDQISTLQITEQDLESNLDAGEPVLEADAQLSDWMARDVHMLQELDQVQETLPGTATAYLEKFQFDVALGKNLAKVRAEGQAKNRDVVEDIYRDFNAEGFKVTPAAIRDGRRDSEYPSEFELNLERPVPSENSTTSTRSPGGLR